MKIVRTKKFVKNYSKLRLNEQLRIEEAIIKFSQNPFDAVLFNHALKGKMAGRRSISAGGDLRIIFEEEKDYVVVIMLAVGSHAQLY